MISLTLEPMEPQRERRRAYTRAPLRPAPRRLDWSGIISACIVGALILSLFIIGAHWHG